MSAELEDHATELLEFLYACPVGLVELSADGSIHLINPVAMQLLLPLAANGMVTNFFTVVTDYAPELRHIVAAFEGPRGKICDGQRIFIRPAGQNGAAEPLVLACTLVKLDERRYIATLFDVSRQVAQERRLQQAETWFSTLLDGVNDYAVLSLDRTGIVETVNDAAARQTGFSQAAMIGRKLDELDPRENGSATFSVQEQIAIAMRDGWHLDEGWRQRANGERYWCQRLIAARSEEEGADPRVISGYTVVLRDVTQNGSDTVKLKELLTTDSLTGASNRAHFFEVAERQRLSCTLQGHPLALIAVDIDHFKQVNDRHGHATGDDALKAVAATCKALIRSNDLFARLGGEEFVVLLPSMDMEGATSLAERLRTAVSDIHLPAGKGSVHITASFGCSVATEPSATLNDLLTLADTRLYEAKRNGRNRVEPCVKCVPMAAE